MFAEFINVRFKDNFLYFVIKLKTVGSMEHFEEKFQLKESFELCRNMGKNLFVAESYLIDDARREGGTRDGSKWDLKTLWMERPSKERNIRVSVRSCLGSWLHKAPLTNILCQFGGAIHKVNYTQQHCLTFFLIIGVRHGICGKHLFSREFANRRIHA